MTRLRMAGRGELQCGVGPAMNEMLTAHQSERNQCEARLGATATAKMNAERGARGDERAEPVTLATP